MSRSDDATIETRVDEIYQLMIQGWQTVNILHYAAQKWEIKDREVKNYIQKARKRIKQNYESRQKVALSEMIARHDDMRSRLYKEGDLRGVLDVDKEDSKLLGLYAPEKFTGDLGLAVKGFIGISPDEWPDKSA
jgi:hypothetical protein